MLRLRVMKVIVENRRDGKLFLKRGMLFCHFIPEKQRILRICFIIKINEQVLLTQRLDMGSMARLY